MYDFAQTFIKNELDAMVYYHIRQWMELPVNSCTEEILSLPVNMCGLDIPSLHSYAINLRLSVRQNLRTSANDDIKQLWRDTSTNAKNIIPDSLLLANSSLDHAQESLKA